MIMSILISMKRLIRGKNMGNKKVSIEDEKKLTANELTDVKDIRRNTLYTKSEYILGYLKLKPINIDLLTKEEKESLCISLTSTFKTEKKPFSFYSIPRAIDMDSYIKFLSDKYDQEVVNPKRKMLLNAMISDATNKVMNATNFEHQFYIKVWESVKEKNPEINLEERLKDFEERFRSVQNETYRLSDIEIIKLCNLFGNSNTAILENYDPNIQYTPIPFIT